MEVKYTLAGSIQHPDRHVTSEHLPWAKSRSPEADENLLMTRLEEFAERFSRAATPVPTTAPDPAQQEVPSATPPSASVPASDETTPPNNEPDNR